MKHLKKYKIFEYKNKEVENWFDYISINNIKFVKKYLDNGFDINTLNEHFHNSSGLMMAIDYNAENVVELLLTYDNLDVNVRNTKDNNALLLAVSKYDKISMLKNLLKRKDLNVNIRNESHNTTPLFYATTRGNHAAIDNLLKRDDLDVTIKNVDGKTFLDYAYLHQEVRICLYQYENQKRILTLAPSMLASLKLNIGLHPDIIKEFPHLISGNDLNLL